VRGREQAAALVLLAFGLFALGQAARLRLGTIAAPGPGLFPLALAAALCVVAAGLLARAWRLPAAAGGLPAGRRLPIAGALGALVVYALVLERVGFLLATGALLVFFFRALQRRSWAVALGGSLVTAALSWLVFKVWLGVNLPAGWWSF
jgi:putative tricarboxylic transport membrane protein